MGLISRFSILDEVVDDCTGKVGGSIHSSRYVTATQTCLFFTTVAASWTDSFASCLEMEGQLMRLLHPDESAAMLSLGLVSIP